ncbi:MAG: 5-(carboxyamino)imidazole ribonucleotide mutase [Phycisphaerae bacterium]|nr:5-(carboxyamino)imidazole ribonucleotide mutase [Phycisphaerae bacterium]
MSAKASNVQVGLVLGSDSDWHVVREATKVLDDFGLGYEVNVISAHRSAQAAGDYAVAAAGRGLKVIIAAAGMAAHLAGAMAANTTLPVIGIPVASGPLGGVDALLATVQMPPGVPVATVAIGPPGARNAGVLAVQILALSDEELAKKLTEHKANLARSVSQRSKKLQERIARRQDD